MNTYDIQKNLRTAPVHIYNVFAKTQMMWASVYVTIKNYKKIQNIGNAGMHKK